MAEQPQGTEYTLQGVMRFLQMEWHSHERARNAWDIERAEMKAKIAKQEGETRSAKKLNESLDRQIRMLERVLKAERAKTKALASGEKDTASVDRSQQAIDAQPTMNGKGPSKLQELLGVTRVDPSIPLDPEHEVRNDKAKQFSQKSIEELTYLLSPPSFPPPPEPSMMSNSAYPPHDPMAVARDAYLVQQHRQQQQMSMSQLPSLPNQHPPPVRMASEYMPSSNSAASYAQEHLNLGSNQDGQQVPIALDRELASSQPADEVEQISYTVDASDEQIRQRDITSNIKQSSVVRDEADDWNFDDTSLITQPAEPSQARRPDTDPFPSANNAPIRSPPRPHRRKSSGAMGMIRRRSDGSHEARDTKQEVPTFKVKFALRGHLDVVRSVIFTGGGSPSEPEVCTTGDDGLVKRWIIPSSYGNYPVTQQQNGPLDLDIQSYFTHRGHEGMVTCLAASPPSASFSTGGRALGDGWVFSGGQDATILVWERGRVDPKARLEGHTDAIWALCVLPAPAVAIFGQNPNIPSGDRILLISGSADHTVKIWAVSSPPQLTSPQNSAGGGRRGVGGTRRHSLSSGSNFPSSPQPSTASGTPFHYTLIHSIELPHNESAVPTSIAPLGSDGENFVVAYSDSSIIVFDTRTGDEMVGMQSSETYDGTRATGVNAVVVTSNSIEHGNSEGNEDEGGAPTARDSSMEGVVISGHEDRFVKFFDANSGQCTYSMLAHPSSIASLSLSPDGRELVTAGHDASLRFWSLETRSCTQEITSHRLMRGEGVVSVVWSQDGRWIVSGGGDGVVKIFAR